MNLDGLNASHEWTITAEELDLKNAFHTRELCIKFPPELINKRGVFFLDLLSSGKHARSVIKVGDIQYVSRISEAGHVFQLLDENNQIISNSRLYMDKQMFTSIPSTGEIILPFSTRPKKKQSIVLERVDDPTFNVFSHFHLQSESYNLQCGIYVDREQLFEKKRAEIVVRAALFLNTKNRISIALLKNIKLSCTIKTGDGVDVDKSFNNFVLHDNQESIATFTVPNEPFEIRINLQGEVINASTNSRQTLRKSVTFQINQIDKTSDIASLYLIPQNKNAFVIALYGKNGEGLPNKDLKLTLYPRLHQKSMKVDLTTDDHGRCYLPQNFNHDFYRLQVHCPTVHQLQTDWDLDNGVQYCDTVNSIQMITGSSISIPYKPKCHHRIAFALFDELYTKCWNENHLFYDYENGYFVIKNLPRGKFILKVLDLNYDINVTVVQYGQLIGNDRYNVNNTSIVELSTQVPLQISKMYVDEGKLDVDDEDVNERKIDNNNNVVEESRDLHGGYNASAKLCIQLSGFNDRTRVHIYATHMV